MRAVRRTSPGTVEVRDVEVGTPGPGEVLVDVEYAGVNPFDTYMLSGTYAIKPTLPYSPGADGAGVIEVPLTGPRRGLSVKARLTDDAGEVAHAVARADLDFSVRLTLTVPEDRRRLVRQLCRDSDGRSMCGFVGRLKDPDDHVAFGR